MSSQQQHSQTTASTHLWTRLTAVRLEDQWMESLHFIDPASLVIKVFPASRSLRLQVYTDELTAKKLLANFGGAVRPFDMEAWRPPAASCRTPQAIGKKLRIYNNEKTFFQHQKKASTGTTKNLCIPAEMAFGTGDHATTKSCLLFLVNLQKNFLPLGWSLLDLGTGSGILALAGELLGAEKILGVDFDPKCVSTAEKNASLNQLSRARFCHANVLHWQPPGSWDVVAANIYSSVLTVAAPKIVQAIKKNGYLILSGILAVEQKNILATFKSFGLEAQNIMVRGPWCAILLKN